MHLKNTNKFLLILLLFLSACDYGKIKLNKDHYKEFGTVFYSIDKYYESNKKYPKNLKLLVPKFMEVWPDNLPPFCYYIGDEFYDEQTNNKNQRDWYAIKIESNKYIGLKCYDSLGGKWYNADEVYEGFLNSIELGEEYIKCYNKE